MQRHSRPSGADLIFQPEGPGGVVGVHHEDEGEEADLFEGVGRDGTGLWFGSRLRVRLVVSL